MKKIVILLAAAGLLMAPTAQAAESAVTLEIAGMTCEKCVASVRQALRQTKGVSSADVDLNKERAAVRYDSAKVSRDELVAAVSQAGGERHTFKVTKITPGAGRSRETGGGASSGGCCAAPAEKGGE